MLVVFFGMNAKADDAKFDFATNGLAMFEGITELSSNSSQAGDFTEDKSTVVGEVTLTVSKKSSGNTENRMWDNKGKPQLRMYTGTLTFEVPEGYVIQSIVWDKGNSFTIPAANSGSISTNGWTATDAISSVILTFSKACFFNSITVTYAEGSASTKQPANLVFQKTAWNLTLGKEVTKPTLTFDTNAPISYESSMPSVATVDASTGDLTLLSEGSTTITAKSAENDSYLAGEASYVLTVSKETMFRKVTTVTSGKRYLIVANNSGELEVAKPVAKSNNYGYLNKVIATASDDVITLNSSENAFTIEETDGGYMIQQSDGRYLYQTGTYNSFNVSASPTEGQVWTFEKQDDGTFKITNVGVNKYIQYYVDKTSYGSYSDVQGILPSLYEEIDENSVSVTITAPGYATIYYSDKALTVPTGVTASTYKVAAGKLAVSKTYAAGAVIPAGTGVVLQGEPGEYTFQSSTEAGETDADNMLKGSDVGAQTEGEGLFYKLSLNANEDPGSVGFYWGAENGGAFASEAHKAYLVVPASAAGAKSSFLFNEATGISSLQTETPRPHTVYTIGGVRVSGQNMPAGVYIVDGKKVVVKK